jgi:hypothetical protein
LVELLTGLLALLLGRLLLLGLQQGAYLLVQRPELLLQFVVSFLLVLDVGLPVDKLRVGSIDGLLEQFGAFDGGLDFDVGFLLLRLFLEFEQFGFEDFVF